MYAHVGGLVKRVNVLSKQDELFFASMHKEQRKARAWGLFVDHPGFCLFLRSPGFTVQFSSVQSHLFLSPIGAWTLKMPVPYSPSNVETYTRTPSHNHPCSAVGTQNISLRSDDLVMPKLPGCGCE